MMIQCTCSIRRNRERLLALGLPGIMKQLQKTVKLEQDGESKPKKKRTKKKKISRATPDINKAEQIAGDAATAPGLRRSRRLQEAAERPIKKEETVEEQFNRQLGEFIVNGECPKCGRIFERGHRAHLQSCSGRTSAKTVGSRSVPGYSAMDKELLSGLSEEDKKDAKKRALARMKALDMSGLVEFTPDSATFIVIGSKGDPYTITLSDEKHKCTCLDHRFRRHNCKHILLVLSLLGTLEDPSNWRSAVEIKLDELIAQSKVKQEEDEDHKPPVASPARGRDAEMAMKFV